MIFLLEMQKLQKATKWLQCNWDFMNKTEVKIKYCILPTLAQLQSGAIPMKIIKMAIVYIYQKYLQTKYKLINPKLD